MGGKSNMSLLNVEAYALPSSSFVKNDSHCFVVTQDRKYSWKNRGRGWDDGGDRTKVAENTAYKEWLWEFVPPTDCQKCGISFYENGVCHTYANRELLIGEREANASQAPQDHVCVFFFGKYGLGLQQLKQLLSESYNNVKKSYNDPYNALSKVLARVDNTVDDELRAWRQTAIDYAGIPVDDIMAKNPQAGLAVARDRMRNLISKREKIYQDYKVGRFHDLHGNVKMLIQNEADDYLNMLAGINYITENDKQIYSNKIRTFLSKVGAVLCAQREEYLRTGHICDDFTLLENLHLEE